MPKKSKKNPQELAGLYKERLAHSVNNVDKWAKKTAKMAASKKYPTSTADKQKIVDYLAESFAMLRDRLTATDEETAPEGFTL